MEDGQVECEYNCGQVSSGQPSTTATAGEPCLFFQLTIRTDPAKIKTPKQKQNLHTSIAAFALMLQVAIQESGLDKFCKPNR